MAGPRYRVLRAHPRRGAAEIFEAIATDEAGVERRVAISRIHPDCAAEASIALAFETEAERVRLLGSGQVVEILDHGVLDGVPFTVTEWIDGLDLESLRHRSGGVVPLEAALLVAGDVAAALTKAHQAKDDEGRPRPLVHGDVRPHNVIVSWQGEVKLCDFQTAWAHRSLDRTVVSQSALQYQSSAPEVERGEPIDHRADIYALGAMLHLLLTGKNPPRRTDPEASITMNPALPTAIISVIAKATRTRPEARYSSVQQLRTELLQTGSTPRGGRVELLRWLQALRGPTSSETSAPALFEVALTDEADPAVGRSRRFSSITAGESDKTQLARAPAWSNVTEPPTPTSNPLSQTPPSVANDSMIGVLVQSYRIEALIGAGATARVYRARHPSLPIDCAIKVLAPNLSQIRRMHRRFEREAAALKALHHPNVVEMIDYGMTADQRPFFVMPLLEGKSLRKLIGRPLSFERVAQIALDIARGLEAAHACGLLHRDLKPGNIMLVPHGDSELAKIVDFGCTRSITTEWQTRLTRPGSFIGTAAFAAPEQMLDASEVDERADLYGLGAVLYALLTGRPPFRGELLQIIELKQTTLPTAAPDARGLGPIAMRLLSIKKEDRPRTATEVVEALTELAFSAAEDHRHDQIEPEIDPRFWLGDDEPIELPKSVEPSRSGSDSSSGNAVLVRPATSTVPILVAARRQAHWALYVAAFAGAFLAVVGAYQVLTQGPSITKEIPKVSVTVQDMPVGFESRPVASPKPRVESLPMPPVEAEQVDTGRVEAERPSRPPRPRPQKGPEPEGQPKWSAVLSQRLGALGLEPADLRERGGAAIRAFDAAVKSGDRAAAATALEVVVDTAQTTELHPARLSDRLDRLQERLKAVAGTPSSAPLEQRFLDLRSRLSKLDPGSRAEFSRAILALDRDAERARP